jgi:nucleotide-binding universal stress UspA family protein
VAIAPANYRGQRDTAIRTIGVIDGDPAARQTANEIADRLGAAVVSAPAGKIDLLVVASRPEAKQGRVMISSTAWRAIDETTAPVLVVPRGTPIRFAVPATAAS